MALTKEDKLPRGRADGVFLPDKFVSIGFHPRGKPTWYSTSGNKKEIIGLMSEAIEVLVLPHIDEIKTDIKDIKGDISVLKEDVQDSQRTTNRIEMRQISELNRVDDHEIRIGKLEKVIN